MAKKKSNRRGKKNVQPAPQHSLPAGFWAQVFAVILIVFGILLVISWFGAGGPFFDLVQDAMMRTIGMAVYVLPILCIYLGIETFRAENNKLAGLLKFGSLLLVVWFSGLFGLFRSGIVDFAWRHCLIVVGSRAWFGLVVQRRCFWPQLAALWSTLLDWLNPFTERVACQADWLVEPVATSLPRGAHSDCGHRV